MLCRGHKAQKSVYDSFGVIAQTVLSISENFAGCRVAGVSTGKRALFLALTGPRRPPPTAPIAPGRCNLSTAIGIKPRRHLIP